MGKIAVERNGRYVRAALDRESLSVLADRADLLGSSG